MAELDGGPVAGSLLSGRPKRLPCDAQKSQGQSSGDWGVGSRSSWGGGDTKELSGVMEPFYFSIVKPYTFKYNCTSKWLILV